MITTDDILGLDVYDAHADFVGVVEKIHVNQQEFEVTGISIDKGFLNKGLMIGREYIDRITNDAVFLNIVPSTNIKSMVVFDVQGLKIGKVLDIAQIGRKNKLSAITVKLNQKKLSIPVKVIQRIGHNVVLNIKRSQLDKFLK